MHRLGTIWWEYRMQLECVLCFLVLCLFMLLAILELFNPATAMKRKLKHQARIEYRNARGSAHLRLLREASQRLKQESSHNSQQLEALRTRLDDVKEERDSELVKALRYSIARTLLTEVEGIGPTLQQRILQGVFRGKLADLHKAYLLERVGSKRQAAISQWVTHYEGQIPNRLKQEFPRKKGIIAQYTQPIHELRGNIDRLEARQQVLQRLFERARKEMDKLQVVSERDFVIARMDPTYRPVELDYYVRGAFAEWESVPAWFKELVSTESK